MVSIIEQIQSDALDKTVPASDLLRRVKLAAAKLGLTSTVDWVNQELRGYGDVDAGDIPPYRVASGSLMTRTRWHGLQVARGDPQSIAALSINFFREPISAIDGMIQASGDRVVCAIDLEMAKMLASSGHDDNYEIHFNKSVLHAVTDHVRNLTLDWAINLEAEGISGEGVSFSSAEKKRADNARPNIQINNYGYLQQGNNHGDQSRVNINSNDYSQNTSAGDLFSQVKATIQRDIPDEGLRSALQSLIAEMRTQQGAPRYRDLYNRFMATAADHIGVVTPFLPALAAFLPT